ncbi:hypothetical protein GCK72_004409 [Caenorhabditis remanei]|uniref:DUF38 domain-containing protein n=1 Tax=Caenorhabditis remanei TaxID=31234 RepID=A0A6A5HC32_CAERE|nr:hypothetical protein GCK72_004409 [Caenorhabditis remanei]KAF1764461.1 hypothetical protein GCK72_004409 [Caenorhabditis remanei]
MSAEYPSEKCLLTLPHIAMNKVLGKLDFRAVQCLRKTCHTMWNFIDAVKPDSALTKLQISVYPNYIISLYLIDENSIEVKYCGNEKGCDVEWRRGHNRRQRKLLKSEDFVNIASRDIISVLTNQKSVVEFLMFEGFNCANDIFEEQQELPFQVFEQLLSMLESHLVSKPEMLQVKTFETAVTDESQILYLLPHLDVKNLTIRNRRMFNHATVLNTQELIELDQWKQLDTLNIVDFCVDFKIDDLLHLKRCFVKYERLDSAMIEELKEAFRISSHLEFFRIEHGLTDIQHSMDPRYADPLINRYQFGGVTKSWFFSVSTPERVLKVLITPHDIVFDFDLLVNVPEVVTVN